MDVYQHFRKDEQTFIDQVLSWQDMVERTYQLKLSDFLNPREQFIFNSIIGKHPDFNWGFFGGNANPERKRALLAPYYHEIGNEDYGLTLLEASYPEKFISLMHSDVLGAFLSLGIKRKKLGDLIVMNGSIQIIVVSEIAPFVKMNLTEIKKAKVLFQDKPLTEMRMKDEQWVQQDATVSSLRLDTVIKEIYRISRQNATSYIQKGVVKVNFKPVEDPSFAMQEGDLISLRGKGRSELSQIHGKTKKEKWRIVIKRLK